MSASDLYKAGRLQEAIDAQIKEVKNNPGDHAKRLFLFELLAFAGDLDRAQRQIEAVNYEEIELVTALMAYRKMIEAERARRRLFAEGLKPQFLVEPPEHVHHRLEALNRLREKNPAEAAACLSKAEALTPAYKGLLNDKPFTALRDCDDVFAAVLEVLSHGTYFWLPFEHIESLAMNAPKFPRDLLWVPAKLEVKDGPKGDVFLPALYHGSHAHVDDQVRLGRMTDWNESPGGPVLGVGLRTFLADDDDALTLLEWRQLQVLS